jgi:3-oxoacyl-[acyl-carrier-protein] synthase III
MAATGFDLNSGGCAGGVFALQAAAKYVADGTFRRVAVVLAETMSKLLDWSDRDTAVIFGDGAACLLLERCVDGGGIQRTEIHSDASRYFTAHVSRGPRYDDAGKPISSGFGDNFMSMVGRQVLSFALENVPAFTQRFCKDASIELDELELIVLHQANLRLVHRIVEKLGLPLSKTMTNVEKYGNTSGAGVPLVLWEAQNTGRLRRGDPVLAVTFGTGMSYGGALIRWCDRSDFFASA